MKFSPRLTQLLFILLNSNNPIPAAFLAESMNISKRTVFRELENIDNHLSRYNLKLETKSKKGINIIGKEEEKNLLLKILRTSQDNEPINKEERQDKLIQELLKQDDYQKIYYYSSKFKVSDSTINNDLDVISVWFENNNINLIRKSGLGIYLEYKEQDYRKACLNHVIKDMDNVFKRLSGLVSTKITTEIIDVVNGLKNYKKEEIAESSYKEFIAYLSIITDRIMRGKRNNISEKIFKKHENSIDDLIVNELVKELSKRFKIDYTKEEVMDIYIQLKGSKLQNFGEIINVYDYDINLQDMIYEMVNNYDKALAHQLKQDNDFIKGLIAHIKPTIVRLRYGIKIQNPYQEEIRLSYSKIYEKSKSASKVMENTLKCEIPEEEVGLIAVHFGGAEARLNQKIKLIKKVSIGVVCSSGIGISSLLSSKIKNQFYEKVHVRKLSINELNSNGMQDIDILISTFDLPNSNYSYIKVNPMLRTEDIKIIEKAIDDVSNITKNIDKNITVNILPKIEEISLISEEISSIIRNFDLYTVDSQISFDSVITFVSKIIGKNRAEKECIANDLRKREQKSTQVIPEFEFVLLHATTSAVNSSKLIIVRSNENEFRDEYFSNSKAVVVMLIPKNDPRQVLAISSISNSLFDDNIFLENVKKSSTEIVKNYIEKILKDFLKDQIKNL